MVGGGPAGSATAIALQQQGVSSILVLDATHYENPRIGESLLPDVLPALQQLNVDHRFLDAVHLPSSGNSSSWGSATLGHNDFVFHPLGHGWHIDRRAFDQYLVQQAANRGAEVCLGCRYRKYAPTADGMKLVLATSAGSCVVDAQYVVDATGLSARVSRALHATRQVSDRSTVVYGYFQCADTTSIGNQTLLEACEYGWWYRSKLPGNRVVVTVALDKAALKQLNLRDWQCWLNAMASTEYIHRGFEGARFDPQSLRVSASLTARTIPANGKRWLAVGDALAAVDPILGLGIVKALRDGIDAASLIAQWLGIENQSQCHWQQRIDHSFDRYLQQLRYWYQREQRWPQAAFWQRRHSM